MGGSPWNEYESKNEDTEEESENAAVPSPFFCNNILNFQFQGPIN